MFTGTGLYKRSRTGINYPYIFPANKEIPDKIPTVTIAELHRDRRRSVSVVVAGPDPHVLGHRDLRQGPPHVQGRRRRRILGRGRLRSDQRQRHSRQHQQPERPVRVSRQHARRHRPRRWPTWRWACSATTPSSASARSRSGGRSRPTSSCRTPGSRRSNLTIEGGVRWAFWPPWHSQTNNIANFDPQFYNKRDRADHRSGDRPHHRRQPLQRHRPAGHRLQRRRDEPGRSPAIRRVLALFRGQPAASRRRTTTRSSRGWACHTRSTTRRSLRASAGIFHNRVTLNDSSLLGGNPPFQPQVSVSNGSVDNPGGGAARRTLPFAHDRAGRRVQAPDRLHRGRPACSARCRSASSSTSPTSAGAGCYLQRERNINQLPPGTLQANPGVNIAALRPYLGYGAIRLAENAGHSKYNSLQISADRRYTNGLKVGVAYTLGKSRTTRSDKRNVLWNTYDDTDYLGTVELRPPARAQRLLHLRPAVLERPERRCMKNAPRRLADLGRDLLPHRHAVLGHADQRHRRRRRRQLTVSRTPGWRRLSRTQRQVLGRRRDGDADTELTSSTRRRSPRRRRARSATRRATCSATRANSSGTSRCSRTSAWAAPEDPVPSGEVFNFINHPNLSGPET